MKNNYDQLVKANLDKLYRNLSPEKRNAIAPDSSSSDLAFPAFGASCRIQPEGVFLDGNACDSILGILITLYALHATGEPPLIEPFKAFADLPGSMPYAEAFATHTENILVPHVDRIENHIRDILERFDGIDVSGGIACDFALLLKPLPKIALCYIFYRRDDEFPASVKCLFSNNAAAFMPTDALADVGEYTSRAILKNIGI